MFLVNYTYYYCQSKFNFRSYDNYRMTRILHVSSALVLPTMFAFCLKMAKFFWFFTYL